MNCVGTRVLHSQHRTRPCYACDDAGKRRSHSDKSANPTKPYLEGAETAMYIVFVMLVKLDHGTMHDGLKCDAVIISARANDQVRETLERCDFQWRQPDEYIQKIRRDSFYLYTNETSAKKQIVLQALRFETRVKVMRARYIRAALSTWG